MLRHRRGRVDAKRATRRPVFTAARAAACAAGLIAALMPGSAGAIGGGALDGGSHPYVGSLLDSNGRPFCSVVYVRASPHYSVVLTSAHCLFQPGHAKGRVRVAFASSWVPGTPSFSGRFFVDPAYSTSTHMHDVAVIVLDRNPRLPRAYLPSYGAARNVQSVQTVGFGTPNLGQRRVAREEVNNVTNHWLWLTAGDGNTCDGDSGGPDMIPGTDTVVALTDLGTCSTDQDTRVDTVAEVAFIRSAATY